MTLSIQALLDQILTVKDLMTPRADFCCVSGDRLSEASVIAQEMSFDLLPVEESGRLVGIWYDGVTDFEPLTDRWLVSRDTSIPDLLTLFVESQRLGFLVLHCQEIVGLVTPADLNKLPVRVYVYNLIGELELRLAGVVQNYCGNDLDKLCRALGEKRWKELVKKSKQMKKGNVDINPVQLLYLRDLLYLIITQPIVLNKLGLSSDLLLDLNNLRNQTMHLVRPLLEQPPEDLTKLHERVQRIEDILQYLEA